MHAPHTPRLARGVSFPGTRPRLRPMRADAENAGAGAGRRDFEGAMRIDRVIPMQPVAALAVAIDFYERLGFLVEQRNDDWGWAMLACGDCRIMLDQSINTGAPAYRAAVLYLYPDDIVACHRAARERGLPVPDLHTTFYGMTEFRIDDPDGNRLWIGQDTGAAR